MKKHTEKLAGMPCLREDTKNPFAWTARWISVSGEKHENFYFLARKRFVIARQPEKAILRVAADSRYALYMNGRFVGNGPARGTHRRYFFDSYDIADCLQPGDNWIAAEVHCPVRATYTMAPNAPALLLEIEGLVATDASWQVRRDPAHRADAPVFTKQIGFSEWKDMSLEPAGWWMGKDGNDEWQQAVELGEANDFGNRKIEVRPIAGLTSDPFLPAEVVDFGRVPGMGPGSIDGEYAARMTTEAHRPPGAAQFSDVNALRQPDGVTTILPAEGDEGAFVTLDFGRELFGSFIADVETPSGTIMDIGYAEHLCEKRLNAVPFAIYHRLADRFVLRAGRQGIVQRLHSRGCRYVQIVFRNSRGPVRIYSARFLNRVYSREPRASFACSDPLLNQLWQMCVNTMRLCSSDTFMDCPWREQALWLNDQAVTNLLYLAMTGDSTFAAHNLRMGADGVLPNGLIPAVYPSARENVFPIMPSLWAWTLADYHAYTGDDQTLRELLPIARNALRIYDDWRDEDGLVPDQPEMWNFIDWGYRNTRQRGKTAALNMAIAAAYKCASALEKAAGDDHWAQVFTACSRATVRALNKILWDDGKGLYRDCTEPIGPATASQHPLAVGLAFGLLDEPQRSRALENLLRPELIQAELYFQHYVLQALVQHGRMNEAIQTVRQLWGPMVRANSFTVWESKHGAAAFNGFGSLCHAFSCAPLYVMQAGILGIRPLQPGFREFAWNPQPGDLTSAEGEVPAPCSVIRAGWRRVAEHKLEMNITVPQGTRAILGSGRVLKSGNHRLKHRI